MYTINNIINLHLCTDCTKTLECGNVLFLTNDNPTEVLTLNPLIRYADDNNDVTVNCSLYIRGPPGATIILDVLRLDPGIGQVAILDGSSASNVSENGRHVSRERAIACQIPLADLEGQHEVKIQATIKGNTYLVIHLSFDLYGHYDVNDCVCMAVAYGGYFRGGGGLTLHACHDRCLAMPEKADEREGGGGGDSVTLILLTQGSGGGGH